MTQHAIFAYFAFLEISDLNLFDLELTVIWSDFHPDEGTRLSEVQNKMAADQSKRKENLWILKSWRWLFLLVKTAIAEEERSSCCRYVQLTALTHPMLHWQTDMLQATHTPWLINLFCFCQTFANENPHRVSWPTGNRNENPYRVSWPSGNRNFFSQLCSQRSVIACRLVETG